MTTEMSSQVEEYFKAVQEGDVDKAKTFLDAGVDVNIQYSIPAKRLNGSEFLWKCSALMYTSRYGFESLVSFLLSQDHIDVNAQDGNGSTALILAAAVGNGQIIRQLLHYDGIDVNCGNFTPLYHAAKYGQTEALEMLLNDDKIDVSVKSSYNGTAFEVAAANGHIGVLKALLDDNMVDQTFLNEHSALLKAAALGHANVVRYLFAIDGINLGETALHFATKKGRLEIVRMLLDHDGIEVNLSNEVNESALHYASSNGYVEIARLLLERGVHINAQSKTGYTALHNAIVRRKSNIVQALLAHGHLDLTAKTKGGRTALDIALAKCDDEIVRLLVEYPGSGFTSIVDTTPRHSDFECLITAPHYFAFEDYPAMSMRPYFETEPKVEYYYSPQSPTNCSTRKSSSLVQNQLDYVRGEKEDAVHFAAYAPPIVGINVPFNFVIWAFLANQREEMQEQATSDGSQSRQLSREMLMDIRQGASVHIHLEAPSGFTILEDGPTQTLFWKGELTSANYTIQCTLAPQMDQVMFRAKIIVGEKVIVLKSFIFVSSMQQQHEEAVELKSTVEWIPEQYEEIPYQDLNLKELVGQGHFGDAYRAEYKGNDVVVKTLKAQAFGASNDEIVREFRHEAAVLSMFGHHPNIVPFVGASTDSSQPLALVTGYLPFGSLHQYLSNHEMTVKQKEIVLKDAAAGLLNIHEGRFINRDIAARNLLVDGDLRAKICDFGLCRRMGATGGWHFESGVGPLKYMAPESLSPPHSFSQPSDVYSFGVLMWETFTEATPYKGLSGVEAAALVLEGKCLNPFATGIPSKYVNFIACCFCEDPSKRPTMTDIYNKLSEREVFLPGIDPYARWMKR
ncbi:unnamed protein product [Aphanomyces euteiches]